MEYSTNKNRSSQVSNLDQSNDKDFGSSKQSKKHTSADVTNLINTNLTRETFDLFRGLTRETGNLPVF